MRRPATWFAWKGRSFSAVNFGWGMLAHIYPGGKLVLNQTNAGGDRWIFTHFTERLSVRALMVKTLNVTCNGGRKRLPGRSSPMSYQDAIRCC